MTSQTGKKLVTIHILPNISRPKGNQKKKFDQLIDYNKKYFLLKNPSVVEKLVPHTFIKIEKLSISLDQQSKMLYCLLLSCAQVDV